MAVAVVVPAAADGPRAAAAIGGKLLCIPSPVRVWPRGWLTPRQQLGDFNIGVMRSGAREQADDVVVAISDGNFDAGGTGGAQHTDGGGAVEAAGGR